MSERLTDFETFGTDIESDADLDGEKRAKGSLIS